MLESRMLLRIIGFLSPAAFFWSANVEGKTLKLTGRVIAADGHPVAGDLQVVTGPPYVRARSFWTDSQGRFSINVEAEPRLLVVAKAAGYISAEREIASAGQELSLDFVLQPAGQVSGRVVDDNGRQVAGALVRVHYPGEFRRLVFDQEAGNVRSDDLGYFTVPAVAQGRPFVLAASGEDRLPGFTAPLTLTGVAMQGVLVTLSRAGQRVRIKVVDWAGAPVPEATVRLQASGESEPYTAEQRQTRTVFEAANRLARTGVDGSVEFRGVPAGTVTVAAGRPGGRLVKQEALLERARTLELTFRVP